MPWSYPHRQTREISPRWVEGCKWRQTDTLLNLGNTIQTHIHTNTHTQPTGRSFLDEWSAHRTGRYLRSTQHTRQMNVHALNGTRTRTSSKRSAADPRLRLRPYCSQNRHNTANQHLSGYTLQERVATFKPTTVLSIPTTLEFYAHCSKCLARLSARNKLTLLAPDSRGR